MLSKALITGFAAIAAVQALPSPSPSSDIVFETLDAIPDGAWQGIAYANGTTIAHSLGTIVKRSIIVHARAAAVQEPKPSLDKRFVECWGDQLDRYGTDDAAQCLRNAAAQPNGIDVRTGGQAVQVFCITAAVRVYYCVDRPNSWGNANLEDINYGLSQMDSRCPAYRASYFRWDGTPEIVGKSRADTNVCLTRF